MNSPRSASIEVVVVWNDADVLQHAFLQSKGLDGVTVTLVDNRGANEGLPSVFNRRKQASGADWLVFCHQDFVFLDPDWVAQVRRLDPDACYGPIGVDKDGEFHGRIVQTDGSLLGHPARLTPVEGLDEQCAIVPRALFSALDFDETFRFHFYIHDYCLEAARLGFASRALQIDCQHKSSTLTGDLGSSAYLESKRRFMEKHAGVMPLVTTTFMHPPRHVRVRPQKSRLVRALEGVSPDLAEMVGEQIEYRELLIRMTARDLLLRYKQTVMGFGWAIFTPLLNTAIFSVIFTRVAPLDTGMPYPVFAYCGLLAWTFFASSLKFAATSLTTNTGLVTKVYFPREVFPFSAVIVALVDFGVASLVLVAMMVFYAIPVGPAVLFLPVVLAVHVVFTMAVALMLSMANLFYRDVKYLFEVVINVWMFATPVVYPVELMKGRLGSLLQLNPMTPIIDAYRAVLLRGELPPALPFLVVSVFSVVVFMWAWVVFHRAEFTFAENV